MSAQGRPDLVRKIAYPLCIGSIVLLVPVVVAGIWQESAGATLWKLAGTLAIVAFGSALALSASHAVRGSGGSDSD